MRSAKGLIPAAIAIAMLMFACKYIVIPIDLEPTASKSSGAWSAFATNIGKTDAGALRIELAVRNDTGDWSAMQAAGGKPAVLVSGGKANDCGTVFVGTGGHRLAPGFQMRGFTTGTPAKPEIQLLYVECPGLEAVAGSRLTIEYSYVTGQYNYYEQDRNRVNTKLEFDLDTLLPDASYPVADPPPDLIRSKDAEIVALNKVVLALAGVQRTEDSLQFTWRTSNPGEYPSYVHIGNPPVIGQDGILYGFYETPDIVSVPITPAGDKVEWTTQVAVPEAVKGLYIMLSVETGKARLFANYAIDITDK